MTVILLGHGSGGRLSHELVAEHFLPALGNEVLAQEIDHRLDRHVGGPVDVEDAARRYPDHSFQMQDLESKEQALVALNGLPGAPGVAIGQAMVVYPPANLEAIPDRPAADIETEVQNFQEAVGAVQDDLRDYANRMSGILPSEELALFDALLLMLGGDTLVTQTVELIRQGHWAPGALRQAERMVADGADILDTGGESTRPGAAAVTLAEELDRVIPVIEGLSRSEERRVGKECRSRWSPYH